MEDIERAVASYVRTQHEPVLSAVEAAGHAASADWPATGVADGARARAALRAEIDARDIGSNLVSLLCGAATVVDEPLDQNPVPAPPYVVVTSSGVLLRATLEACRLLIELRVFQRTAGCVVPLDAIRVTVRTA